MKKIVFPIIALVFILLSCDNAVTNGGGMESGGNPFIGTWLHEENGFRIVFTKTTISGFWSDGRMQYTGTYTYDDTRITIKLNAAESEQEIAESWGDTHYIPYRFEGEILFYNYARLVKIPINN
jgi:uncharacterized lipoprotein NlpE involved in copper resistance